MHRKKTTQAMKRAAPARAGFTGKVSTIKNATGTQILADKSVPKIATASRPVCLPISERRLCPV
jgi:hypothetical protein